MKERQFTSSTQRQTPPGGDTTVPTFQTSSKGRYLGRVIVEAWEPDEPGSDGIAYVIQPANPSPDFGVQQALARTIVSKLARRLGA